MIPNIHPLTGYCKRYSPGREFSFFTWTSLEEPLLDHLLQERSRVKRRCVPQRVVAMPEVGSLEFKSEGSLTMSNRAMRV